MHIHKVVFQCKETLSLPLLCQPLWVRRGYIIVAACALFMLGKVLFLQTNASSIQANQDRIAHLTELLATKRTFIKQVNQQAESAKTQTIAARLSHTGLSSWMGQLSAHALAHHIEIKQIKPQDTPGKIPLLHNNPRHPRVPAQAPPGVAHIQTLQIYVVGSYHDLIQFIASFSQMPMLVTLRNWRMCRADVTASMPHMPHKVHLTGVVQLYAYKGRVDTKSHE